MEIELLSAFTVIRRSYASSPIIHYCADARRYAVGGVGYSAQNAYHLVERLVNIFGFAIAPARVTGNVTRTRVLLSHPCG